MNSALRPDSSHPSELNTARVANRQAVFPSDTVRGASSRARSRIVAMMAALGLSASYAITVLTGRTGHL